jgi:hypothetical protein
LKGFITIDSGTITAGLQQSEIKDEEQLMKKDEEEMANIEEDKLEDFDKVEMAPTEDGAEAEATAVINIVAKRLPRVAEPIGDVMREIINKDIGEENIISKQAYNHDEILQIIKK